MPKFPVLERRQGLGGGATASYASAGAFMAPANAVADMGGAVSDLGAQLQARQQKVQNSQDDTWFSKARADTAVEMDRIQRERQQAATDGAEGFTQNITSDYEALRQRQIAAAPSDRARQMYDEWSYSFGATVGTNAAQFQAQSTLAKRDSDFASAMLAHSQLVLADPSQYDAVHRRAMDDLEGAKQWMTPEQEQKARSTVERELQLARAKAEIQRDPSAFLSEIGVTGEAGPSAYRDAIASIESAGSGDYGAIGPKHPKLGRALGRYQIMEANIGPWSQKHLGRRVSVDEFMANPAIQDAIFDGEFGSYVAKYGLEGAAQAWFAGEGGVGKTDRKDSLGTDVGSYGKKFLAALGKSTPNVAGDARYSHLDVGDVLGLQQQAEQAERALATQQQAELTRNLAQMKGAFQLGIVTGDPGVTQQSILSSPLADDDKAQLIRSLNSEQADGRLTADTISRIDMGGAFDPHDSRDKKGVGLAYDSIVGDGSLFGEDGTAAAALGYIYSRTGIVPPSAGNEIRGALASRDPKRMAAGASFAAQLDGIDPAGLAAMDGGSDLEKAAATYNHMRNRLGMTNEEIGERMAAMSDPEKQRQRAALLETKTVKDRIKDIDAAEVRDVFDPGLFGFDPDLGDNPMAEAAMIADYRAMFEESVVDADGDLDLAETLAAQRFSKFYGVSDLTVSGGSTITRLPPDITYPPSSDGTHDYVTRQAIEALAAEGVEAGEVFLQYYEGTEQDFRAGKPPRYQLYYMKDGNLELFNLPFYADKDQSDPDFTANRERRDENIRRMEASRDREGTLDQFLDGNPLMGR